MLSDTRPKRRFNLDSTARRRQKNMPVRGLRGSAAARHDYQRAILRMIRSMERDVKRDVIPLIRAANFVQDSISTDIASVIASLTARYNRSALMFEGEALRFVRSLSSANKRAFERSPIGVDLARIIEATGELSVIENSVKMNVSLIKSISSEYFSRIEKIVLGELIGSNPSRGSMIAEIEKAGTVSTSRAKLIARDQMSKINSALTVIRAKEIGSDEYIWRTVRDERVVGNPSGLYPEGSAAHKNHYAREGRRYRFDNPPSDGHPGEAIGCRCWIEPVVKI